MPEEFKDVSKAVEHLEQKMEQFKTATTKDAQEAAVKGAKDIIETEIKAFGTTWEAKQTEFIKQDATIKQLLEEQKEMKAKQGHIRIAGERTKIWIGDAIAEKIVENKANFLAAENENFKPIQIETKTVGNISTANLTGTGNNYISYLDWQPGMEPTDQFRFRSIFRVIQSETDYVRFPRANTPIGEGSFGRLAEAAT